MCTHTNCKRETSWQKGDQLQWDIRGTNPKISIRTVGYTCGLCHGNSFAVVYELLNWSHHPQSGNIWCHTAVRKIGQLPPQEIEIPAELMDRLGSTAGHYKKALISREQNYGIAAMAYLRRVVDEKTDDLIDVMADLSQTHNIGEKEIADLLGAKKQIRYEEKLKVATELIPEALRPEGVNPLGQLYQHTSAGLHGKTDDECVAIFDDLKADFEYVFRNLHLQAKERREFAKRVQMRAGAKHPAGSTETKDPLGKTL